jgi:hypothetical protein
LLLNSAAPENFLNENIVFYSPSESSEDPHISKGYCRESKKAPLKTSLNEYREKKEDKRQRITPAGGFVPEAGIRIGRNQQVAAGGTGETKASGKSPA